MNLPSDNGPVADDGYRDQAVEKLGSHRPAGRFRAERTAILTVAPSQVDLLASFAALSRHTLTEGAAPDSRNVLPALLGRTKTARRSLVEHADSLAVIEGDWKLIAPGAGPKMNRDTNTELGNDPEPQLHNLARDPGEKADLARQYPERVRRLTALLEQIRSAGTGRK